MTHSASTPRLRVTQLFYALMALSGIGAGAEPRPAAVSAVIGLLALLCVTAACLGRIWCSVFIAGRKDVQLVTDGPYRWCRHPLYAWSLLAGLGLGLATQTWTWPLLTVLLLLALFRREMRREEDTLEALHGAAFRSYRNSTPALWPRRPADGAAVPASLEVRPDVFRKAFLDAASILFLFGLLSVLAALRQAQALPTWLTLP